jgi:alkylhydroperoxidase family enzyme
MNMPLKPNQPRLAPVEPPFDPHTEAALDLLGPRIQLFRVFARRPELATALASWGRYYLSRRSALTLRHRELIIDRTTAHCGADYEWGIHIAVFAGKAGLAAEQIRSLGQGTPMDGCWPDAADRAVLLAVDQLCQTHDLSEGAWSALIDTVGADAALELTLLCGWYHAISFAVRALRLPLEPDTRPISAT